MEASRHLRLTPSEVHAAAASDTTDFDEVLLQLAAPLLPPECASARLWWQTATPVLMPLNLEETVVDALQSLAVSRQSETTSTPPTAADLVTMIIADSTVYSLIARAVFATPVLGDEAF